VATNVTTFAMGPLAMGAGSTLNLSPDATSSLADANYNLTLGATALAGQATFNVGNNGTGVGSLTLGALSDGGTARTIIKEGPGTLVLSAAAASLIDGTVVNVNNGTLRPTNATALGNLAAVALASGSNLSLGANQTVGALSGTGNVALNGNTLTIGSTNNLNPTFAGVIADGTAAGGLTKAGTGTLTLSGANTYSGATTINAGVLQLGSATGLSSNTTVTFPTASTGTLRLNGNSVAVNGLSGPAGTVENASATAAALTVGGSTATTFGGVIQDGAGAGALTLVKAGTGALTLAGANTYTGGTTISGGKLVIGAPGALPDTGTVTIALNGTLSTAGGAGGAGVSETAGTLKTTGSTIELGTGVHTLTFSGLAPLGDLTSSPVITGWTGVKYTSGTQGRIIINNLGSDPNTVYASWLSNVNFTNVSDTGLGGYFLATGGPAGQFELVPVPEPGAVLGFAAAGLAGLGLIRRRFRRKAEVVAAA
jgi:autotransporter-associated beta strand protein